MLKTPPGRTHEVPVEPLDAWGCDNEEIDVVPLLTGSCSAARLAVKDKAALFQHLAARLDGVTANDDVGAIHDALWTRERAQHTGLGRGLAFPHATLRGIDRTYVAVFTLAEPIDYGRPDGETVDVVFASLGPPEDRQTHLLVLAKFSALALRTTAIDRLRAAPTDDDVVRAIKAGVAELGNTHNPTG